MNLTEQLAKASQESEARETRIRDLESRLEGERRRNDMQAGALRESRAQNGALSDQLERVSKAYGELRQLFTTVYGTHERLHKQDQAIAAHELNGAPPPAEAPKTLSGKLSRLRAKIEAAA